MTHSVAVTTPTPAPPAVSNQATASPKPAAQPAPVATPLSTDSSPTVYKGGLYVFSKPMSPLLRDTDITSI